MKLEDIGFYTLSDERARQCSESSPMWRCELILTDKCNFNCKYCRGLREDCSGTLDFNEAMRVLDFWIDDGLKNVRFSGGEPTLYHRLPELVGKCDLADVGRIAISTNGSMSREYYDELLAEGVNDFSISLDSGCCSIGDDMAGKVGSWEHTVDIIEYLSEKTYVTVGMVFTEDNVDDSLRAVCLAHDLGVSDIRVISAAQYNKALEKLVDLPEKILDAHPILKYRIDNFKRGRNVRGITESDSQRCSLVLDDMAIAGGFHFPCIIYMREGGDPIGKVSSDMRGERKEWSETHDCMKDPICKEMCLDVCIYYNNKVEAML